MTDEPHWEDDQREDERWLDHDPEDDRERFGAGVCSRGTCVEPCGPNGGCVR